MTDDGLHGKIVSMTESEPAVWAREPENEKIIRANDKGDGAKNMKVVQSLEGWKEKYPIFKWCADLGDGWYLPSVQELYKIKYNANLINPKLKTPIDVEAFYWSSTEQKAVNKFGFTTANIVYCTSMGEAKKSSEYRARAIAVF